MQTDHYRELAARSDDEEIKTALHQAAETIEGLILKHEAADRVAGHYPDGTLCVEVNDLDNVKRVIVEAKKERFCKLFYEESKQIPKKPEMLMDTLWTCPTCGKKIDYPFKHCKGCGQAIDWEGCE
jgi:hypothetical protein